MHWVRVKLPDNFQIREHSWPCLFHITVDIKVCTRETIWIFFRSSLGSIQISQCSFSLSESLLTSEKADDPLYELPVWLKSVVQFPDWFRIDVSKKESENQAVSDCSYNNKRHRLMLIPIHILGVIKLYTIGESSGHISRIVWLVDLTSPVFNNLYMDILQALN